MSINSATITVAGNIVANPDIKHDSPTNRSMLVRFRVAVNRRRYSEGKWEDASTMYIDVDCWNQLAKNVHYSLRKGMGVIVTGELVQSSWVVRDEATGKEQPRSVLRVKATNVGADLNFRSVQVRDSVWVRDSALEESAGKRNHVLGQDEGELVGSPF